MKLKQQSFNSQEQLSSQRLNQIDEQQKIINENKREIEKRDEEIKLMKFNNDSYKSKLEEAQKLLEDNEKLIRYLNQNMNNTLLNKPLAFNNNNILSLETNNINNSLQFKKTGGGMLETLNNHRSLNTNNNNLVSINNDLLMTEGTSYKPLFSSNAFQTQGNLNTNNNNYNNYNNNDNFETIKPFTNFTTNNNYFEKNKDQIEDNLNYNNNNINNNNTYNKNTFNNTNASVTNNSNNYLNLNNTQENKKNLLSKLYYNLIIIFLRLQIR